MVVLDSSAWIEFSRDTGSPVARTVGRFVDDPSIDLGITEIVVMEVLAGARNPAAAAKLRSELIQLTMLRLDPLLAYEEAAAIYRAGRRQGITIRKMTDCLIAVPVIKAGASLLHADADFDRIAQVAPLRIEPVAL